MASRIYNKWRQGSSAAGDPDVTEYNSTNAQVYENGTLGPRPGWRSLANYSRGSDSLTGLQWYQETDADEGLILVFWDGAWKYNVIPLSTFVAGGDVTLPDVAGSGGPGELRRADWPDGGQLVTWTDGSIVTAIGPHLLFATSSSPGSPSAITTDDGDARSVTINRERAYYWGMQNAPGRIFYSNPADYSTVEATSSFDTNADYTSFAGAPIGLWSIQNALLIAHKDNRWSTLTGASPENGTFKEVGHDVVPDHNSAVVVDNQLMFLSPTSQGVVVATPGFIDAESLRYLSPTAAPDSTEVRPSNDFFPLSAVGDDINSSVFLPGIHSADPDVVHAVEKVNGVFNLSTWDLSSAVDEMVFSGGRPNEMYVVVDYGTNWNIYSRNHTLNRPASASDTKSGALGSETGAGSEAVVTLGEIVAGPGRRVRPTKVVLDVDYWKGGPYTTPTVSVDATVLGTESTSPEDVLAQQSVSGSAWGNTTGNNPSQRRVSIPLPQGQFGTRFRVKLAFDNIALDAVEVQYEETDDNR